MKSLKPLFAQKFNKKQRQLGVLIGLVDHYIKTGKPVGSNTLRENGFDSLSSATIRNYFSKLEKEGYLMQQHSSGGRVPTNAAFKAYASFYQNTCLVDQNDENILHTLKDYDSKEIGLQLQNAIEKLSDLANLAAFLSSPRFDNDFITQINLVTIDCHRCLCVILTNFGLIHTEVLTTEDKISSFALKRIERYFHWRLTGQDYPEDLMKLEEILAQRFYNEIMVRYIVGYANFSHEDMYTAGFSKLLSYPEFHYAKALSDSLSLFENFSHLQQLLLSCCEDKKMKFWIGEDFPFGSSSTNCSVIAVPYRIQHSIVGAVGVLGPTRIPYHRLFGIIQVFSDYLGECLTKNIFKFKITFRNPQSGYDLIGQDSVVIDRSGRLLLESKKL